MADGEGWSARGRLSHSVLSQPLGASRGDGLVGRDLGCPWGAWARGGRVWGLSTLLTSVVVFFTRYLPVRWAAGTVLGSQGPGAWASVDLWREAVAIHPRPAGPSLCPMSPGGTL